MPSPETLDAVAAHATRVATLRKELSTALRGLRSAIREADANGHGRNEIARQAAPGLSRKLVLEALGASDLTARADEKLRSVGIDGTQFLLRTDPRPMIALGSEVGEEGDGEEERRRIAQHIAKVLFEAGIVVDDVDRLADWEFTTLSISNV